MLLATPDPVVDFAARDALYGTSLSRVGIGLWPLATPRWLRGMSAGQVKRCGWRLRSGTRASPRKKTS